MTPGPPLITPPTYLQDVQERNDLLQKCASTSLNSKLVSGEKEFFSKMVVDAVATLDPEMLDLKMIGIKKVHRLLHSPSIVAETRAMSGAAALLMNVSGA